MAKFVEIPATRLDADVLQALLEDFASRDGTDYGAFEYTLEQKISQLRRQLDSSEMSILYDADSDEWDLLDSEKARDLLLE